MAEASYPRDPTNGFWGPDGDHTSYSAEASDLGIMTGLHPAHSREARDPWHRPLPSNPVVWSTQREGGDTRSWTCTVRAPDGVAVKLVVFND